MTRQCSKTAPGRRAGQISVVNAPDPGYRPVHETRALDRPRPLHGGHLPLPALHPAAREVVERPLRAGGRRSPSVGAVLALAGALFARRLLSARAGLPVAAPRARRPRAGRLGRLAPARLLADRPRPPAGVRPARDPRGVGRRRRRPARRSAAASRRRRSVSSTNWCSWSPRAGSSTGGTWRSTSRPRSSAAWRAPGGAGPEGRSRDPRAPPAPARAGRGPRRGDAAADGVGVARAALPRQGAHRPGLPRLRHDPRVPPDRPRPLRRRRGDAPREHPRLPDRGGDGGDRHRADRPQSSAG